MSRWARWKRAPADSEVAPGDLVVGIVRRPDPQPCPACAVGEWDMCRNGGYTERGIKERHGYGAERFRIEPEFVVKVDPALDILGVLLEPASVLAKAWEHIERIGQRARGWQPREPAGHRRGPDRPARRPDGKAARARRARARPQQGRPEGSDRPRSRRDLSYRREHPRTPRARRRDGMHRRRRRHRAVASARGRPAASSASPA